MLHEAEILKLLLPDFLIDHFQIVKFAEENKILHVYFEEKSAIPQEFSSQMLQSKGFLPEITVDDFPLRGKSVKLHIKRRRWTDKNSGEILQRDWNLIAKGTRVTIDFAEFLKKNQPILKHLSKRQLVNFMVWMVESFKDNTKKALAVITILRQNLM